MSGNHNSGPRTHGMRWTPVYNIWRHMKSRCSNPNHKFYHRYGGRGIKVCDRWMKFENFLADMGENPKGMSIERIDNAKGYYPANCKWANQTAQSRNRVTTKLTLELANEARRRFVECAESITSIAKDFGVHRTTIGGVIRERVWLNSTTNA